MTKLRAGRTIMICTKLWSSWTQSQEPKPTFFSPESGCFQYATQPVSAWVGEDHSGLGEIPANGSRGQKWERESRDWRDVAYTGKGGRMTAGRFLPPVLVGSLEALPWQPARQEALRRWKRKTLMSCSIPSKRSCALWLVPQFLFIVCVLSCFSCDWLFATLWTAAGQAPLSVGFPRLEYWSGFPFPSPEDLLDSGIKLTSPASSASPGGFFTTHA